MLTDDEKYLDELEGDDDEDEFEELDDEIKEYLATANKIMEDNKEYIELFKKDLVEANLTKKTIRRHAGNVNLFTNYYLADQLFTIKDGPYQLEGFFERKSMCPTAAEIKAIAASLKKFYKSMLKHEKIDQETYDYFYNQIKNNLDIWMVF